MNSINNKRNYIRRKKYLNDCITHIKAAIDFISLARGEKIDQTESQKQAISHAQQIEAVCWSPHSRLSADGYQKLMQAKTQEFTRTIIKKNLPSVDLNQLQKLTEALLLERSHTPPATLTANNSATAAATTTTTTTNLSTTANGSASISCNFSASNENSPTLSSTASASNISLSSSSLKSLKTSLNNFKNSTISKNPLNNSNNVSVSSNACSSNNNNNSLLTSNVNVPMPILSTMNISDNVFLNDDLLLYNNNNNNNSNNCNKSNNNNSINNNNSKSSNNGKNHSNSVSSISTSIAGVKSICCNSDDENCRGFDDFGGFPASFEKDEEMLMLKEDNNSPFLAADEIENMGDATLIECAMMRIEKSCDCSDFPFAAF